MILVEGIQYVMHAQLWIILTVWGLTRVRREHYHAQAATWEVEAPLAQAVLSPKTGTANSSPH